jgi:hypothetical protein
MQVRHLTIEDCSPGRPFTCNYRGFERIFYRCPEDGPKPLDGRAEHSRGEIAMLTAIEDNGLLLIRADGTLSDSDYDRFVPFFERVAARVPGTVPMLIELAPDFSGWDMGGLWRDLKFDAKHKDSFGRIAMVGDSSWEEWGTKLFDPLFRAEMRFFTPVERVAAESWARDGRNAS